MIGVITDCGIYGTVGTWSSYQVCENLCLSSTVLFLVVGIGEGIGKKIWEVQNKENLTLKITTIM